MASVFTKIIRGELPSCKLYEDEFVYAFLDIRPVRLGHSLVVPKVEIDHFADVPEPYYSAVFQAAKYIAPAIQKATGAKRIASCAIGIEVPHFHYHLIPIDRIADLDFSKAKELPLEEIESMRKRIVNYLV